VNEIEAELERRARAKIPLDPVPPPKRSYSPAPQSSPVSISPVEAHLRDTLWRQLRRHAPAWLLVVAVGGGSGYVGKGAQETAQSEALKASLEETAKLRREQRAMAADLEELTAELRKNKREDANTAAAHLELAQIVAKVKAQAEKLEGARTAVIRAEPLRPPR
jgi:hypothetical protein